MSASLTGSQARLGGIFNLLQSGAYLVAGGAALFIPLRHITDNAAGFSAYYTANPAPLRILALALIALGLFGLTAVVPATAALLNGSHGGWVMFGKSLALLSLAVIVVYYTWFLSTSSASVAAYVAAPAALQPALGASVPAAPINWVLWFMFGGMGLWVVIVGVLGRLQRVLPPGFALVCAVKTAGFWLALAGVLAGDLQWAQVGVVLGVLIGGPMYHGWLGVIILNQARRLP